jgi:hypothetical protein
VGKPQPHFHLFSKRNPHRRAAVYALQEVTCGFQIRRGFDKLAYLDRCSRAPAQLPHGEHLFLQVMLAVVIDAPAPDPTGDATVLPTGDAYYR